MRGTEFAVTKTEPPKFPPGAFDRVDEIDDAVFYRPPRLVTHIDDQAIAALSRHYADAIEPRSVVLDLMSSWVSHLPGELELAQVIGHGMNAAELEANPRLTGHFVQDLNRETSLPLDTDSCDAALCCVSVQYLQKPLDVFSDVRRVLKPGAQCIVSFSNRYFPTKAVAIWRALDLQKHASLVHIYLNHAGFSQIEVKVLANGMDGDPLMAVSGKA